MAKSLAEYILEFARQARNQLAEEVAKKNNAEVKSVTWEGYDADGNPLIKDRDKTRAVRGLGNVSQVKGSKLIYDTQNTIEYKRQAPKKDVPQITKVERKVLKDPSSKRFLLEPLELFLEEINVIGDFILATNASPWGYIFPNNEFEHGLNSAGSYGYSGSNINRAHFTYQYPISQGAKIPATSTDLVVNNDNVYSLTIARTTIKFLSGVDVDPSTSQVTVNGQSAGVTSSRVGSFVGGDQVIDFGERNQVAFSVSAQIYSGYGSSSNHIGWGFGSESLALNKNAKRFFSTQDNENFIDLNSIVSNKIIHWRVLHEFRTREISNRQEDVYIYSIFYVMSIDADSHEYNITDSYATTYDEVGAVGKVVPYFVHTRYNLTTGQLEHKKNVCSFKPGYSGNVLNDVNGINSFKVTSQMQAAFPFGAAFGYRIDVYSIYSLWYGHSTIIDSCLGQSYNTLLHLLDPEPIFTNAYEGDWISRTNITFPNWSGSYNASTEWTSILNLLDIQYSNGTFKDWESNSALDYPDATPCFTYNSRNALQNNTWISGPEGITSIADANSVVSGLTSIDPIQDQIDISSWVVTTATQLNYSQGSAIDGRRAQKYQVPNVTFSTPLPPYPVPTACYEVAQATGLMDTYVSGVELDYHYNNTVLHYEVPLSSYTIVSAVVTIETLYASFAAGGSTVVISGAGNIDGTYTISGINSLTSFYFAVDPVQYPDDVPTTEILGTAEIIP